MLFGHGDDHYNSQKEVKINFSSNVWHGADLRTLREHLNEQFYELTRYPEPDASSLKRLLARCYEVEEENIVVTNGSITAFYLLAQTWKGAKSAIAVPSFAEYEDACRLHGHEVSFFPTSCDLSGLSLEGQDFCWICNPNNPAYVAFTTERLLEPSDVCNHPNLILIQSISKAHNIPGLRIGYLIASPDKVEQINRYIIPWSVNAIAVEAGKYILTHPEQYILPICEWQRETASLIDRLNELGNLEALPTSVTFFLARLKKGTAADLKQYLWDRHGLLIRDASNFRSLDERYIRISAQTAAENRVLVDAVREWLSISP